jgi:hypothetical protein
MLGRGGGGALLADAVPGGRRRERQNLSHRRAVIDHVLGLRPQRGAAPGEQLRITGPGTYQVNGHNAASAHGVEMVQRSTSAVT